MERGANREFRDYIYSYIFALFVREKLRRGLKSPPISLLRIYMNHEFASIIKFQFYSSNINL